MLRYYTEDEMLMLSGIQHFSFCPRQWWLIQVDQSWEDNHLTAQGQLLHQRVNQPEQSERRGTVITLRAMPIASSSLGLYGIVDVVELHPSSNEHGYKHPNYPGHWTAFPVEYKRGAPKGRTQADKLQLCAEAICIEEMYEIHIPHAYIYYGETRHRLEVELTPELREETYHIAHLMHEASSSCEPIAAIKERKCRGCSLIDLCLPEVSLCDGVSGYYEQNHIASIRR